MNVNEAAKVEDTCTIDDNGHFTRPVVVDWDGPDDVENPKNWPGKRKWLATAVISWFTLISPVSSAMVAPAVAQVADDLDITSEVLLGMTVSIFVLAYAFGPLLFGPLSEVYGRARILQLGNAIFCVFNLSCGFAQTKTQLMVLRFFAGIGGSPPLAVGGAAISDMFKPEERGKAVAIYSLAPLLGPSIGPVAGGFIAENTTWRWVFWSTTIAAAAVQCLGIFFLDEGYAPLLLARKARRVRSRMGLPPDDPQVQTIFTYNQPPRTFSALLSKALVRPFRLWFAEPIIQILGLYMAYIYGIVYLTLTTIPSIYKGGYHESISIAGLHYIALGLGLFMAAQTNARLLDLFYRKLKDRNGGTSVPEHRLPSMVAGTIALPVGLLLFGWSAQYRLHWIVPDIGLWFIGAGMILNFQSLQIYIIDSFTSAAASALAAVTFFRSCAGFGFPLFAGYMFNALGYGKGNTILAACAVVLGCPAPWLLFAFGARLRAASRFAAKGDKAVGVITKSQPGGLREDATRVPQTGAVERAQIDRVQPRSQA